MAIHLFPELLIEDFGGHDHDWIFPTSPQTLGPSKNQWHVMGHPQRFFLMATT
jgi:hypothetical protein